MALYDASAICPSSSPNGGTCHILGRCSDLAAHTPRVILGLVDSTGTLVVQVSAVTSSFGVGAEKEEGESSATQKERENGSITKRRERRQHHPRGEGASAVLGPARG